MNDLVEGCRIKGEVTLDGTDIFKRYGCQSVKKKSWNGIPETKSISNEHL